MDQFPNHHIKVRLRLLEDAPSHKPRLKISANKSIGAWRTVGHPDDHRAA